VAAYRLAGDRHLTKEEASAMLATADDLQLIFRLQRRDAGGVLGEARGAPTTARASGFLHAARLRSRYLRSCPSRAGILG
jgi:hypothetical protein